MCKPGATIDNRFPSLSTAFSLACCETKHPTVKTRKIFHPPLQDVTDAHERTYALTDSRHERHARNEVRTRPAVPNRPLRPSEMQVAATALRRIRE